MKRALPSWPLVVVALALCAVALPAGAEAGTYQCTATASVGGPPADFTATAGASFNGCKFTDVAERSVATRVEPAEGCVIYARPALTSNPQAQEQVLSEGSVIEPPTAVWARCDAGVLDAVNRLELGGGQGPSDPSPFNWTQPLTVGGEEVNEPLVVTHTFEGDDHPTIFLSATRKIYRSDDDGITFTEISPTLEEAPPAPFTDTSVSVSPDGTVWFTRFWGYPGTTLACRSTDRGDTWSCDNTAIPGVTDRMWIAGVDADTAYLNTMHGLIQPQWSMTDNAGLKYLPYSSSEIRGWNGNMVYDQVNDAVWQLYRTTIYAPGRLVLLRIDGSPGRPATYATGPRENGVLGEEVFDYLGRGIQYGQAFPYLATAEGALWTTGEPLLADGGRGLQVARTTDQGGSWEVMDIDTPAASVTFSSAAAGPDGRVAVVYYGSDTPGDPADNGGRWSLYVTETLDGLAPEPQWVTTRVVETVHVGSICAGVNCAPESDPRARQAGDFMGSWIDDEGRLHVAYQTDAGDGLSKATYLRQERRPTEQDPGF